MRLYDGGRVPNARRVRIFLAEKGITVPMVPVDLAKGEHYSDAYRAKNPLARVPMLELDDGTILTESIAICRYFEEVWAEPPLFGTGPLERAMVEMWNRRAELELYFAIQAVFRHTHPGMAAAEVPQIAEWGQVNRTRAISALELLDARLAETRYLAGPNFSVADITALVSVDFLKAARLALPEDLANLRRWHGEVSARPSAGA